MTHSSPAPVCVRSCLLQTHYSDTWYALLCVTPLVPTGPLVLTCSINNLAAPILSSHTCSYFISTSCLLFDLWCLSSVCLVCVFLWFCQEKHSLYLIHLHLHNMFTRCGTQGMLVVLTDPKNYHPVHNVCLRIHDNCIRCFLFTCLSKWCRTHTFSISDERTFKKNFIFLLSFNKRIT